MRLVFMGSGGFALPSLRALLASQHEVVALITQPDKPAGRGHELRMPPTKSLALDQGISVHQPPRVRAEDSVALLRGLAPECIVVVAYGQIIPASVLAIPPLGIINVHGSLLPRYRGAAPVQWSIARGETETGVTTMLMDEGLDTGPVLLQKSIPIAEDDTGGSLEAKLASPGAQLLLETLPRWAQRDLLPKPQNEELATLAPRIKKEDGLIDWNWTAREIHSRRRAFDPWPVAHVLFDEAPLRIWKTKVASEARESAPPGQILAFEGERVLVASGGRSRLLIEDVQLAGRARMSAAAFARGKRLAVGDRFGQPRPSRP
ncbi:MAG: methionyl-tRNA formyltransferase [Vicinamibacteria bacterium]